MGFFNRMITESENIIHELEINGERVEDEEDVDYGGEEDTPEEDENDDIDYTQDDEGEEPDTPNEEPAAEEQPADGEDSDIDYTIPDDATPEDPAAQTTDNEEPLEGEEDIDYSRDDGGEESTTDDGSGGEGEEIDYSQDDGGSTDDTPAEEEDGGEEDIDYSQDDGGGEDTEGEEPAEGEEGTTDGGSSLDDELKSHENDILADLSDEQKQIQSDELRANFIEMYNLILDTIDKVNNVSKREDTLEIFEFISSQLLYLKDIVNTNITRTFDTKTYFENTIAFQQCLAILNSVKKLIDETNKKVEISKNN